MLVYTRISNFVIDRRFSLVYGEVIQKKGGDFLMDNNQNDQSGTGSTIPAEPVQPTPPATDIPSQGEPMPAQVDPVVPAEPQGVPAEQTPALDSTGQATAVADKCASCGQDQTSCACGGAAASGM